MRWLFADAGVAVSCARALSLLAELRGPALSVEKLLDRVSRLPGLTEADGAWLALERGRLLAALARHLVSQEQVHTGIHRLLHFQRKGQARVAICPCAPCTQDECCGLSQLMKRFGRVKPSVCSKQE